MAIGLLLVIAFSESLRFQTFYSFAVFSWEMFLVTWSFVFLTVTSLLMPRWAASFFKLMEYSKTPPHLKLLKMHIFLCSRMIFFCLTLSRVFHCEERISFLSVYLRWSAYCCLEGPILMHLTRKTDELYIGQHIWVCMYFS